MFVRKLLLSAFLSACIIPGWAFTCAVLETTTALAEIKMSKPDPSAMRAKAQELNAKSHARNLAATERMRRILLEKREGQRGFPKDFNTIPGDKKR
jgi:hypothetical protein